MCRAANGTDVTLATAGCGQMVGMLDLSDSEWVIAQRRDSGGYYPLLVVTGKREADDLVRALLDSGLDVIVQSVP